MDTFILVLHSKKYQIPSNFRTLEDIDQSIYQALITTHQYEIKSKVNESVLKSFIDNWIYQSIPKINLTNFFQYEELSQEFDRMSDIIELYQKNIQEQIISKFKKKIQLRMKRIQNLNNILHQQINQYQKYITFIFTDTNYDTILNNTSIKNNFFQKNLFERNQIFKLIQLMIIEINGLIFTLDKIEKTASIFSIKTKNESIFIPKSIFYEDEEYLIIEICQNAFHRSDHFKTITFSDDSELQIISKSAFESTSIEKL